MASGYRNLQVWAKAKSLAVQVYTFTRSECLKHDYGLVDQIRRASVSIASNIAEGDERDTDKDAVRFFYMSKGSAAELRTQLEITSEVYPDLQQEALALAGSCEEISRMLRGLISKRL